MDGGGLFRIAKLLFERLVSREGVTQVLLNPQRRH
jgi:hypothetical protein